MNTYSFGPNMYIYSIGGGQKIESLDISYNHIGDSGIIHLAEMIKNNKLPFLKHLILKEVDASYTSLEKLFNSLSIGTLLETIDISGKYVHIYIFTNIFIFMYTYIYICIYIYICFRYTSKYVYVYVQIYAYICSCICNISGSIF
jgi:hypothetical protein